MAVYVPLYALACPALAVCARMLCARFEDLGPGHGRYSVLMVWEARA